MHAVHKTDGTIFQPTPAPGRGRPAKYPWEHLEVGDYFKVDFEGITSVKVMISQFKKVGRLHEIERTPEPGVLAIKRKT